MGEVDEVPSWVNKELSPPQRQLRGAHDLGVLWVLSTWGRGVQDRWRGGARVRMVPGGAHRFHLALTARA